MNIKIESWNPDSRSEVVAEFFQRPPIDSQAESLAREILADIRARGDKAVADCVKKFDGASLLPEQWLVRKPELNAAREEVDADFMLAVRESHKRIAGFARAGKKKDWTMSSPRRALPTFCNAPVIF